MDKKFSNRYFLRVDFRRRLNEIIETGKECVPKAFTYRLSSRDAAA